MQHNVLRGHVIILVRVMYSHTHTHTHTHTHSSSFSFLFPLPSASPRSPSSSFFLRRPSSHLNETDRVRLRVADVKHGALRPLRLADSTHTRIQRRDRPPRERDMAQPFARRRAAVRQPTLFFLPTPLPALTCYGRRHCLRSCEESSEEVKRLWRGGWRGVIGGRLKVGFDGRVRWSGLIGAVRIDWSDVLAHVVLAIVHITVGTGWVVFIPFPLFPLQWRGASNSQSNARLTPHVYRIPTRVHTTRVREKNSSLTRRLSHVVSHTLSSP